MAPSMGREMADMRVLTRSSMGIEAKSVHYFIVIILQSVFYKQYFTISIL